MLVLFMYYAPSLDYPYYPIKKGTSIINIIIYPSKLTIIYCAIIEPLT